MISRSALAKTKKNGLNTMYIILHKHFGDLGWWPAKTDFEVMIGAILTQNTAWRNVERAIQNLKANRLLDPFRIGKIASKKLSCHIRPCGYYRVKTEYLKAISRFITRECKGKLNSLKAKDILELRKMLLEVKGIGPETADSILLYALDKSIFVVDAYTKRIFSRHNLIKENATYDEVQNLVHRNFPLKQSALNQFHALLVETGKQYCRKKEPLCGECPLKGI